MWGWTCFAQGAGTDLDSVTGSATGRRERPLRNGTKTRTQRSRSHRTLCPLLWLFYLGASENTFLLEWAKILPQTGWRSFLLLVRRPSLSSSLLRCVLFFFFNLYFLSSSCYWRNHHISFKFLHLPSRCLCSLFWSSCVWSKLDLSAGAGHDELNAERLKVRGVFFLRGSLLFFSFFFCRASITWCVWHVVWSRRGTKCLVFPFKGT